jgi:hypothetical protein
LDPVQVRVAVHGLAVQKGAPVAAAQVRVLDDPPASQPITLMRM